MKEKNTSSSMTDISTHLKAAPKLIQQVDLQQDYNYFQAQKVTENMLELGLISLSEFNKLSQKKSRYILSVLGRAYAENPLIYKDFRANM